MSEVFGHEDVRRDLAGAVARDDLPGSLLIHGPPGVGRQTLARWLARLLVCEEPGRAGPCGECRACRLALDLQHPDIHWFFPLPRPKGASSPEKLADALEEARFEGLAERRENPLYQPPADEPVGLYLAQVRTLRKLGSTRPAMGPRQIFIVANAELLVPQEASQEAANALLKLLEEPPPATTIILTAAEPEALIPTIRSRLLPVRLRPFPEPEVRRFLAERTDADEAEIRLAARLGRGSIGRALAFLPGEDGESRADGLRKTAAGWLKVALNDAAAPRFAAALEQRPSGARGAFSETLDFLGLWLRDLAAVAAGAEDEVVDVDAVEGLRSLARGVRQEAIPGAIQRVEAARDAGRINANPQLTLTTLLNDLAEELRA
ncbi:MAG: DNA polymerase III subunit delta' C-terminal domain-containing protein [Longimicrobiales bacterium]|nr:DNA polymerase III subunit delta' C-terminal domain-containing protein [Longimicrobiales bacterium]